MHTQEQNREVRGALRLNASPELRKRLKVRAAQLGTTMRDYATEAVERRLDAEDAERGEATGSR